MLSTLISSDGSGIWLPAAEISHRPSAVASHELYLNLKVSDPSAIFRAKPQFSTTLTSCMRVVEVRYHPLGTHNIILVLENVDSVDWRKTQRFVVCKSHELLRYVNMKIPITEVVNIELYTDKVLNSDQPLLE
jgi:hypothetical protein